MGVKLEVWKQGQFYPALGKKIIELPYAVYRGPSDQQVKMDGFDVQFDGDGNFLNGSYTEDELDAISTYGTARHVIDLYENLLGETIKWSWQKKGINEPLLIRIRNNDINARFLKDQRCIELDYYGPYGNWTYNSRTVDLIAHEVGHAILDSVLPHLNKGNAESMGIGEAFCDLSAMFFVLSSKNLCKNVITETGSDLRKNSILTLFGAGHGFDRSPKKEIRSALNDFKYHKEACTSYYLAQVLIGFLYDLLCDIFEESKNTKKNDFECLYESGKIWIRGIVNTFLDYDSTDSSFYSFIKLFYKHFFFKTKNIKMHLKKRELI